MRESQQVNFVDSAATLVVRYQDSMIVQTGPADIFRVAIDKADLGLVLHARLHQHRDIIWATVDLQKTLC